MNRSARRCGLVTYACALTIFLAATVPVSPAHADISVSEGSPHAALFQTLYDRMSDAWKSDTTIRVQEVSQDLLDRIVERSGQIAVRSSDRAIVDGCYEEERDSDGVRATITLRAALPSADSALVFLHEYGHFVWSNLLDAGQRAQFGWAWRRQKCAGHLVTRYAAESKEEGFAEAFSYFIRKPDVLHRRDSAAWRLIRRMAADLATQEMPARTG